jgi:hypothetical protein
MVQGGKVQKDSILKIHLLDMGRSSLDKEQSTVNDFLKEMKKLFGSFEYKATSKNGQVFKSSGYAQKNKFDK